MADILIRMEMPKSCFDCIFENRFFGKIGCNNLPGMFANELHAIAYTTERNPFCPLIPLPEGHGRLIDADKLAEDLQLDVENDQRALDDLNIVGVNRERIQFEKDCKQNCMWYLSECPTIVPAEGGTDE